jgi:hypothetical protein
MLSVHCASLRLTGRNPGKACVHLEPAKDLRPALMARAQWKNDQPQLDPAKLVFVDESGASTKMARLYGRAKRGHRLVGRVPW